MDKAEDDFGTEFPDSPTGTSEAHRVAPLVDGRRIRRAREAGRYTQAELVQRTNRALTTSALSQIERCLTRPTAPSLQAIAAALGYPMSFFATRLGDDGDEPSGHFRSLRSTSGAIRKQALAHAFLVHDLVVDVERAVRLPESTMPDFPIRESATQDEIAAIAERVRRDWAIPPGPIDNMVRLLERQGVIVACLTTDTQKVDAFSVYFNKHPVVVLTRNKRNRVRSRFDAGHELAHLVMHRSLNEWAKHAEQQAHWFASAFLLPADQVRDELPSTVDWRRLAQLKQRWGVSMSALLMRARDLRVITPAAYVNAMKVMSARGWRKEEPGDDRLGSPESPALLESALTMAAGNGLTVEQWLDRSGMPVADSLKLLAATEDPRPRVML